MFLMHLLIALMAIFKSYPCYGDTVIYLSLLPLWRHTFQCKYCSEAGLAFHIDEVPQRVARHKVKCNQVVTQDATGLLGHVTDGTTAPASMNSLSNIFGQCVVRTPLCRSNPPPHSLSGVCIAKMTP